MIDIVKLKLLAGNGGNGRVSFRREKYVPKGGPDGGSGGLGGSIIIKADQGINTLSHLAGKKKFQAEHGQMGGKKNQTGKNGQDLIIKVPVGTAIWLEAENEISQQHRRFSHLKQSLEKFFLEKEGQQVPFRPEPELVFVADDVSQKQTPFVFFEKDGQEYVICKGGQGGKGNKSFASAGHQVPLEAEYGEWGEQKYVVFELQLLADIGLVGFPNAGKSTFLSIATQANPKIANYPFTTIEPNLGILSLADGQQLVMADIPGLIAGASQGKGLGHNFLKHISHCKVLLFVLSLEEAVIFDDEVTQKDKAEALWQQFLTLQKELSDYSALLSRKPFFVVVNKSDLFSNDLRKTVTSIFKQHEQPILFMSGVTGEGVDQVKDQFQHLS